MNRLEALSELARTAPERFKKQKEKGLKLIGYTGWFIPEELIYASGAIPYLMCRGGDADAPETVLPYMLRCMNPFSRAQIGYHLAGVDPILPMVDLVIAQCDDCHMSRLADLLEYFQFPTQKIGIPADWEKSISSEYYYTGLDRLKDRLESLTANEVSNKKLKESIDALNGVRDSLRKISLLRKEQRPPIGGYEFFRLNHFSFYCPLNDLDKRLNDVYEELRERKSPFSEGAPRMLFAGHVVAVGDYVIPKLIEDSGGVIVAESFDEGIRQYLWNVKTDGDLMRNLGEMYYYERTPPSIFQPAWKKRLEFMKKVIEDLNIDAVVWYQLMNDEIYDMECSFLAKSMEEIKMPFLKLESSYEYSRESMGPLTTRIESFIESTKQKRS